MDIELSQTNNDYYQASAELIAAINTALFLKRPLLLAGEPGTGKTECANFVARQLHQLFPDKFTSDKALRFDTKSGSQSTDLFYSYDAVAHFGDKSGKEKENFISFNSLGISILGSHQLNPGWEIFKNYRSEIIKRRPAFGSVVLIDEIDKAPRDFPNDLLAELEKPPFKFSIKELPDFNIEQNSALPIFIIISSNNEKGLPDAFLRRCVFHYIKFPEDDLLRIVTANLKFENPFIKEAIARFMELRKNNITKKPATSELIDWISCLQRKNLLNATLENLKKADAAYKQDIVNTLGILAKSKVDFETLSKTIAG